VKIRNRHLVKLAGVMASFAARGLARSLRFHYEPLAAKLGPRMIPKSDTSRHLYAIWHENLLLPAAKFGDRSLAVLISKHADGQILASLIESMGMGLVLGSTNRGGIEAVRKLLDPAQCRRHLAVTPDGPRGPRRIVQPGIIYIASRTGMKIVAVGVGYKTCWRAKSWDRFAIPKPVSEARIVTGEPIHVPEGLKMNELEEYRQIVQAEMDRLNALAEYSPMAVEKHVVQNSSSKAA
jgi:lysophospholipid acyltransferase (LPLAT)-like uncharacterized protein